MALYGRIRKAVDNYKAVPYIQLKAICVQFKEGKTQYQMQYRTRALFQIFNITN